MYTKQLINHFLRFPFKTYATFLIKSIVVSHFSLATSLVPSTQMAKSLVMKPCSTVEITDFSKVLAKFSKALF